jgi:hypothetical protein
MRLSFNGRCTLESVHLLWHVRTDDLHREDAKLIGVFRSHTSAATAASSLRTKPGFSEHPSGFEIVSYELDEVNWREGFLSE